MLHHFPFYLALIAAILLLVMIANRIKVAYPIVLVLAGLVLSFIPSLPHVVINPDLIFIIFLPPLLYEAAWDISWKELWLFRRVVSGYAVIIVILTSLVVAWVASSFIPGFSLALGFLLGGIVSPPDAVSATAILKNVKINRHVRSILEGESLLNDASSLIIFRFALIAIDTGRFALGQAALSFLWVIFMGIAMGLAVAYIFYLVLKWLPTDANTDIIFTLIAPYAMYIAAEAAHVSGVLAVVSGGLFLSARQHIILSNLSRLQGQSVWSSLGFLLNGLIFMLIGLQLPVIANNLGDVSLEQAIGYSVLISVVLIVGRILSGYGTAAFTKFASRFITVASIGPPNPRGLFIFGWTGMRGVVSLAAALSIPPLLTNGQPFPQRNMVLFITFVVILFTLVVQGLTLPWLIRRLGVEETGLKETEQKEDRKIQQRLFDASRKYLNEYAEKNQDAPNSADHIKAIFEHISEANQDGALGEQHRAAYYKLLEQQRRWLQEWNKDINIDEETIRKHLMRIDLEEAKINLG